MVERLEPKQELLARVEKTVGPEAVVSSDASGLPLHSVAEGRSDDFGADSLARISSTRPATSSWSS